jgi:hypothetical protein
LPEDDLRAKRRRAIVTRLQREDWTEMARAAFESPNHVSNIERWLAKARADNPGLDDQQHLRLAQHLRTDYYQRLSEAGVAARRARAAIEAIERTGVTGVE